MFISARGELLGNCKIWAIGSNYRILKPAKHRRSYKGHAPDGAIVHSWKPLVRVEAQQWEDTYLCK